MPIIARLDRVLLDRRITLRDLSSRVGITVANLSHLKNNRSRAIRFSTLEALCRELDCQPADLLEYSDPEVFRRHGFGGSMHAFRVDVD